MKFDVRYEHELTDEQKIEFQKILDKNIGDSVKE